MALMTTNFARGCLMLLSALTLASCGGGGGSAPTVVVSLTSIALSPLTVSLPPLQSQQLTVTGTFSNGSKQTVAASGESFKSSNTAVATVSATGVVTVVAGAPVGAIALIVATDTASGKVTAATVVTVIGSAGGPTANSAAAAMATVKNNAKCSSASIDTAYYWEIGDKSGPLIAGTQPDAAGNTLDEQGNQIAADTSLWAIASGSKWVYGTYVVQASGSANILNGTDPSIPYLNFTSGYTYLGNFPPTTPCPNLGTVNDCLAGLPTTPDPNHVGHFYYDSDHLEENAAMIMGLGGDGIGKLATDILAVLGNDLKFSFSRPLLAAGIDSTANDYGLFLRRSWSGQYQMSLTLSANAVCTNSAQTGCSAIPDKSPIATASNGAESWHYSMAHWIEDDPVVGDGAFSSPGALGWYPWIDKNKTYYGLIARTNKNAAAGNFEGYQSAVCGRLIRNAWQTGVEQTGPAPMF